MAFHRLQIDELVSLGEQFPAIGIVGPRQVGKTTLVKQFMAIAAKPCVYLDLEKPSDYAKLQEPELFLSGLKDQCVILDEIQLMPELFGVLRSLIDDHRVPLRFIVLGSASPHIIRGTSESLAGRIAYMELHHFSIIDAPEGTSLETLLFRGGFPEALFAKSDALGARWVANFIKSYVERDLPLLGLNVDPPTLRTLLEMLAWMNGNLLNYNALAKSMGTSNHTITRYLDFLEGAFLIRRLPPYHANVKKRLVKSPKLHFADAGVLNYLSKVDTLEDLFGHPHLGHVWETFVVNQLISILPDNMELFFYATHAGAELDLLIVKSGKPFVGIEIKYTATPYASKGLVQCIGDLGTLTNFIITPKSDTYPVKENILACSVADFVRNQWPKLL